MKTKNFFRSKFDVFYIVALVARSYFTNATVFVSSIILPILIYFILSLILPGDIRVGLAVGIAISSVISTGVLSFAVNFFEWRNSVIYKKVKISLISEFKFYFAFILFYLLISFLMFWFLIIFVLFYEKMNYLQDNKKTEFLIRQIKSITSINWMLVFVSLFQLALVSILIGLLIGLLVSSAGTAQAIGLAIYLTTAFVTSCYISLSLTAKIEFLRIYGNIIPVYPSVHAVQGAWLGNLIAGDPFRSIEELIANVEQNGHKFADLKLNPYDFPTDFPADEKLKLTLNFNGGENWKDDVMHLSGADFGVEGEVKLFRGETLISELPAYDVSPVWARETSEGLEFLNYLPGSEATHQLIRHKYTKFSILGPYWAHALASLGWTVILVIAIWAVNKFKYNRR